MPARLLHLIIISLLLISCSDQTQQNNQQWQYFNYWASWCKPCIEEIPEFNRLAEELKGQASVYAVNFDGIKGSELQQQASKIGIAFNVLEQDPAQAMGHPKPSVLPSTYIYSPDGKLHKTLIGPQTLESLKAAIAQPQSQPQK